MKIFLAFELRNKGLTVETQKKVPVTYKGIRFEKGFRANLLVEEKVIVEMKSVENVVAAHKKQAQTCLKLTGCKLGDLLNFGEAFLRDGITRCVNGLEEKTNPLKPPIDNIE
jgi:GxxExxY protein